MRSDFPFRTVLIVPPEKAEKQTESTTQVKKRHPPMKRNTRLHSAALTGLVAIGIGLATGGFINNALGQDTNEIAAAAKRAAMNHPDFAPYPDQHFPNRVSLGRCPHPHRLLLRRRNVRDHADPRRPLQVARGGEVVIDNGERFKHGPAAGLARHHRPCRISRYGRSNSRWQPRAARQPDGQAMVRHVQAEPAGGLQGRHRSRRFHRNGKPVINSPKLTAAAWAHATEAAEKFNQPGVFTTLHGFEWTSAPGGNNLHRTVIFRDNVDRVKQIIPFSAFDSQDPADLWKYMDAIREEDGRPGARHPAQRQSEQWPHVHGRDLRRETDGPGLRRGAHQPRAAHGGDAGQG